MDLIELPSQFGVVHLDVETARRVIIATLYFFTGGSSQTTRPCDGQ